jgi:hypothetical protein
MAKFRTYVRVATPEDNGQGLVLQQLLDWSDGAYEYKLILPPRFKEDVRRVADLTKDSALVDIVRRGEIQVSLEELRGVDLKSKVIIEAGIDYEPGEAARLGSNSG